MSLRFDDIVNRVRRGMTPSQTIRTSTELIPIWYVKTIGIAAAVRRFRICERWPRSDEEWDGVLPMP